MQWLVNKTDVVYDVFVDMRKYVADGERMRRISRSVRRSDIDAWLLRIARNQPPTRHGGGGGWVRGCWELLAVWDAFCICWVVLTTGTNMGKISFA